MRRRAGDVVGVVGGGGEGGGGRSRTTWIASRKTPSLTSQVRTGRVIWAGAGLLGSVELEGFKEELRISVPSLVGRKKGIRGRTEGGDIF